MLKQYPDDVKVVHKHFPLRNHQFAVKAALASMAAQEQGKFWEMHDLIFENYSKLSDEKFVEFAEEIQLNIEQFNTDRNSPDFLKRVQSDLKNGVDAGVRGTPTIFVNGRRLKNRSFEGFKQAIDRELKGL